MSDMPTATLSIDFKRPSVLLHAMAPELGREVPRTSARARMERGRVVLSIEARDLSALRAALNSYLRWIRIVRDVMEITGGNT